MKNKYALLAFALSAACKQTPPQLVVHEGWARATVGGQQQASVYLKIDNRGGQTDRLLSARTPRSAMAMLHSGSMVGGVARMREMDTGAAMPAHGELEFKPGGNHIMLSGVGAPLTPGERFPMTLHFQSSGDRTIFVSVMAADASGPKAAPR